MWLFLGRIWSGRVLRHGPIPDENVPAMAKVLVDFAKTHPNLGLVRGVLNGKLVDPSDMETLSKLPSREELLARVLGTMMAPVSAFVNTLAAVPRSFLNVLKAIEEQKSASSRICCRLIQRSRRPCNISRIANRGGYHGRSYQRRCQRIYP